VGISCYSGISFSAGESDPIAMATTSCDDKPHESKNIAFMSSQVLNGEGYGIVIRCGDNSFIGKINILTAGTKGTTTTLERDINNFVIFIAIIAVTMAIVLFSAGMGRRMKFADAFVNGVVVVLVANIPQGLPATVTSALTLSAERMKDASVLVKKTDIIESLGSATRIASDKTGTLTQNKMTVMNCWVNRQYKAASDIVASVNRPMMQRGRSSMSKEKQPSSLRYTASASDNKEQAHLDISEIEMALPPASSKPAQVPRKSSSQSSKFGVDLISKMSMGKTSVGQAV
jgi:magnesium-transporting ATPase (P-type)